MEKQYKMLLRSKSKLSGLKAWASLLLASVSAIQRWRTNCCLHCDLYVHLSLISVHWPWMVAGNSLLRSSGTHSSCYPKKIPRSAFCRDSAIFCISLRCRQHYGPSWSKFTTYPDLYNPSSLPGSSRPTGPTSPLGALWRALPSVAKSAEQRKPHSSQSLSQSQIKVPNQKAFEVDTPENHDSQRE